jgi:hypothetical protein
MDGAPNERRVPGGAADRGEVRVSLHESGRWRYAFTAKHQLGPKPLIVSDEDRAKFR